ncbi:type II CRISPR RNA-guided endonuclease Cas9, partial [Pedobacter sp. ASV28]|uniref:type II CRISPR RNA-guided endonuclease Cas9 n=1 Tax=Pedobacter sp. ASV28 TaxID=2795123 RepID=UPI0018EC2774
MSKRILGLDLGTNSIGWAYVREAENSNEISSIEKIGVRVNPLTVDEQTNFEKGKPITTNANRTLARSARRNLQRYKLRRANLIAVLKANNWIDEDTLLAENGNKSTFETYFLRSSAASKQISLVNFARVLLMLNKKRGYKSSRKVNNAEEGTLIDGMEIAKQLYHDNLTPGQFVYQLLKNNKRSIPDFYRSDLENELDKVWAFQKQFYPEILTDEFRKAITGKGQRATAALFWVTYQFNTAENKAKSRDEKKLQAYKWRASALTEQLTKEEVAYVVTEINNNINNSSGYLGAISDRSKELYFNKQTVGEYLYQQLRDNPHTRLKSQVFYRQDYLDEFEKLWQVQSSFHDQLTDELKKEIRDIIIFYQRKLKSQKSLVSICEFEQRELKTNENKTKLVGLRVTPKSSPLFQEFKIWQI